MTLRGRIVLWSSAALLTLFALVVGAFFAITETGTGRGQIRDLVVAALRGHVHGKLYIGNITEGFFTGVTIDSLAIRDAQDSLFLATGPVSIRYDLRDLLDRRILLSGVHAEHPVVYIRQHEDGHWNFREIFESGPQKPPQPSALRPFIVIDSATVHDATFMLTLPWHPAPYLHGAQRDSAIRFELARKDHEIRRTREGFARTWRWTGGEATLVHGRISHPDSVGTEFRFANVRVHEADPPFLFSNASGVMRQLGDSIWVQVKHFDLPGSTGNGGGKIVWGSELPVRYDIHVHGDSVSLADVDWVYPTLPRTGGGTTDLDIRTEPRNLHLTDFILTKMDVRSTRSHLTGRMTFTIGEDTLIVKDVALAASPVNFDLLRTLNGKPFPYNWQGDITGTVRAPGGNLGRFKVDDAQFTFADANVPGAISRGSAHGELNIFNPAFTAFHELAVNATALDLLTFQALNKNFPRLNGIVSGTAVLDSSWLDVRFHDAQLTHRDGPGPESNVTGRGRVTWGVKYLTYDLDLMAQALAFETLRRSYPLLPLRTTMSGPILVQGESPDLRFVTTLTGPGGTIAYDGRVDADPPVYGAHGTGSVTSADLRTLLGNAALPRTALSGTFNVDMSGDTLPHLTGSASLALAESQVGATTLRPSVARVHFGDGMLTIDTLVASTATITAEARGTLGLASGRTGALDYRVVLGSIADAAKLIDHPLQTPIRGSVTLAGTLTGSVDAQHLDGSARASNLSVASTSIATLTSHYVLDGLPSAPSGTLTLDLDTLTAGSIPLRKASLTVRVDSGKAGAFQARFVGTNLVRGGARGAVTRDSMRTLVTIDTAGFELDTLNRYRLSAPAHLLADAHGVALDSLILARQRGGTLAVRSFAVHDDSLRGSLRTSDFDLGFAELFSTSGMALHGALDARVDLGGTTEQPRVYGSVQVANGSATLPGAGGRFDGITADIALAGDSLVVRRLSAVTNRGDRRGTLDVTGSVGFAHFSDPTFDLSAAAHNFRAIDRAGLASLDVSTSRPLTLRGSFDAAVVTGALNVDRGTVYIPDVIRKRVVDLNDPELFDVVDTTIATNRAVLPHAPLALLQNLRLEGVAIDIGDDVWLRSEEANIKLGGSLNVTLGRSAGSDRPQLALDGQLNAQRGTYRLNVVPFVQPTFDVEQGTLRFFGTPDLDPALDITAINTVRAPQQSLNGQDVRIRATIGGTLSQPTLTLSSADNLPLSQSDLLSYLITGQPAFALDYTTQQYVNQLAAVAVRSAGNVISSAIPRSLFDVVELQTPTVLTPEDAQARSASASLFNLLNTRAVLGKQLNNNLFLNFSTGFCTQSSKTFYNNLGLRLEYRLGRTYSAQFGLEPGSSDLVCARSTATQAIQQTPPQIGVDFLRAWRF